METRNDKWVGIVSSREAYEAPEIDSGPFQMEPWDAAVRRVCMCTGHDVTKFASQPHRTVKSLSTKD